MPMYRNRMWDCKIRLFSQKTNKIYVGLLSYLEDFFKNNDGDYLINLFALNDHVDSNKKSDNLFDISLDSFESYSIYVEDMHLSNNALL